MIALLGFRSCWSGASIALQEGKVGRKGGAAPAQKSRFLHNSNLQIVDSSNCGRSMRVLRNKFFTEASGRCSRVASRLTITSEKRDSLCDSSLRVWGFGDSLLYSRGQSKSEPCSAAANDSSNDKCEGGSPWATFDTTPTVYSSPAGVSRDALLAEKLPPPRLSIAPMMEYTDNHFRHLARLLSRHTWLYTEMVVDNTLIHQQPNLDKWLEFPAAQHPVVLQLGGSDPALLGEAARLADAYGYDEINLNCGCPSNAVAGHGCFGARLMLDPRRVSDAVASMALNCSVPVTIKCRIGVDDRDSYEELCEFVDTVSNHAPVKHFVIHARKALLKGLSPSQNRSVPPLRYEFVAALMRDFPHLDFTLNGGIKTLSEAQTILHWGFKGVMIGRAAYSWYVESCKVRLKAAFYTVLLVWELVEPSSYLFSVHAGYSL